MEDTRPVLLVTTVDIGDGQSGKIEVREGDDPVDAARDFCVRYGLPESIVGPLALHIQENIERNAEESEQQVRRGCGRAERGRQAFYAELAPCCSAPNVGFETACPERAAAMLVAGW